MSLATVIRLEFAYPGVGILAGDSLQYLSIATAHGVIMVFFMIMPAIFGGFGNFLLPTQLGVHDVAFPRLNSAAFWFLPGGLIMLCQLVCVDRRYQRMNCFNIRELQGILKRRFFTDLINLNDHRDYLSNSMINLRFKLNNQVNIEPDIFTFYNFGTVNNNKVKSINYSPLFTDNCDPYTNTYLSNITKTVNYNPFSNIIRIYNYGVNLYDYESVYYVRPTLRLPIISDFLKYITNLSTLNSKITVKSHTNKVYYGDKPDTNNIINYLINVNFNLTNNINNSLTEHPNQGRFLQFNNPLISYDYKCGHYLGI